MPYELLKRRVNCGNENTDAIYFAPKIMEDLMTKFFVGPNIFHCNSERVVPLSCPIVPQFKDVVLWEKNSLSKIGENFPNIETSKMTPNEQIARWLNLIVTPSLNLGKVFMSNKLYPLTEG